MPYLLATLVGLAAGLLGGLAGVGGSILILPALAILFGTVPDQVQHLYMASAMAVNLVVAVPAALRHHKAGAIRTDLLPTLLPATALTIALGVIASNSFRGWQLQLLLAAFLFVYCAFNLRAIVRRAPEATDAPERCTRPRLILSAALTGSTAGLLGLGGGILQVPLLQVLCNVPLRRAIATSSAVICMTAIVGAGLKLYALPGIYERAGLDGHAALGQALLYAGCMAPTAVIGARIGAAMTHRLPITAVRGAITVMLLIAALTLASKGWQAAGA
ncbi:MAG: sulfite exporter TauE/SafE family protein [Phycisphaerales bacterium]